MSIKYFILTNNPMTVSEMGDRHDVRFEDGDFIFLLTRVRNLVHKGYKLLSHPLSGSVKPGETPYKSVMISATPENQVDQYSLKLIENAIETAGKFKNKAELYRQYRPEVLLDFQLVDLGLIMSGAASADAQL